MKKILSLVLALAMVLSCASAMAAITVDQGGNPPFAGNGSLTPPTVDYEDAVLGVGPAGNVNITVNPPAAGWIPLAATYGFYTTGSDTKNLMGAWLPISGVPTAWNVTDATRNDSETKYYVTVAWDTGVPGAAPVMETTTFYVNWLSDNKLLATGRAWYPDNHAHAFQNLSQKAEGSKWKTYATLNLTEGTQQMKLVAAGAWNIGNIIVTVKGDEVVFDYLMHEDRLTTDVWDEITVDSEYINVVPANTIPSEWDQSAFEFGVPYSIANDLGGATEVNLFAELVVDYSPNNPYVYREWTGMNP